MKKVDTIIAQLARDMKVLRREVSDIREVSMMSSPLKAKELVEKSENIIAALKCLEDSVCYGHKPSYTNKEMIEIFGVTSTTLKKWRDEGYLGYSQIGSTYQYSPKDIAEFLKHTHNDPSMFI